MSADTAPKRPPLEVGHAAHRLRCTPERVRQLIADGQLRAWQLSDNGPWRIDEEDLDAFIADRKQRAASKKAEATPAEPAASS